MVTFKNVFIKMKAGNFTGIQMKSILSVNYKVLEAEAHWPGLWFSNPPDAVDTFPLTGGHREAPRVKRLRFQFQLGVGWGPRGGSPPSPSGLPRGQLRNHFALKEGGQREDRGGRNPGGFPEEEGFEQSMVRIAEGGLGDYGWVRDCRRESGSS